MAASNVHFVKKKLFETKSVQKPCCDNPDLINDTYKVCKNCGTVSDHLIATEFVDFYENRYRISKKIYPSPKISY